MRLSEKAYSETLFARTVKNTFMHLRAQVMYNEHLIIEAKLRVFNSKI